MRERNNNKIQKKLSELEKFIAGLLESPMNLRVKRKILADLESYKATLLTNNDGSVLKETIRKKDRCKP